MKQQSPLESAPQKRLFPSRKDYESIPKFKERREFLLAIIKKLEDHMNERNGNDTAVQESKIAELNELKEELESEGITVEYLDQFMQPNTHFEGAKMWTEEARKNPKIMIPSETEASKEETDGEPRVVRAGPFVISEDNTLRGLKIVQRRKEGTTEISIPSNHDLSEIFSLKDTDRDNLRRICLILMSVIEAIAEKKISAKRVPLAALKRIIRQIYD